MKFWFKTFRLLLLFGILSLLAFGTIYILLHNFLSISFITSSLLSCLGSVILLYLIFYIVVYKKKYYEIADNYVESIDLLQNVCFFLFFPYLGIVLSQVETSQIISTIREIVGATLLSLKITMLIIKYTLKQNPLDSIE